ncbi:ligase-associated DNA damage response endonuclease PdeM [Roseovarius sp. 2305UL8-3]|uniref:ligase-associated DNA damage response endonuclease PdeM n=1 Tax=Roseovarius conchicola TaxID=3121636 RepID=UPI0035281BB6
MNGYDFTLAGVRLIALGSGALFWPDQGLLCVSDLHLGKSERRARLGEPPLPPYETRDTLMRLEADLAATGATTVVCLGDSFDDLAAAQALSDSEKLWIARLQAGRRWIWIEGNHDPGPLDLGGTHLSELPLPPLTFRHIARPGHSGEVSGHYHPKATLQARGRSVTRPAFLVDSDRMIMPAYGTYTGGLRSHDSALTQLMRKEALAVLTGTTLHAMPMPR